MRIAFRVDATPAIGLGHLKRSMALAAALRALGAELCFVGRNLGPTAGEALDALGASRRNVPLGDAGHQADAALTLASLPWPPDAIVVDHYGLDRRWHAALREATGCRIVVIDDLADRPLAADLLVDPNPAPDHAAKYRAVLPDGVPICGGPAHALLDACYTRHPPSTWQAQVQTIGVFMGGTDPSRHSAWVLRVLRETVPWQGPVRIASTSGNLHLATLRHVAAAQGAALWLDRPDLADFHAGCDLQIGAGGGALWERCCLGVPTIALVCADNQRASIPQAAAQGAVLGLDAIGQTAAQAEALADAVRSLIAEPGRRLALRERSLALVDGQGAGRVASAVQRLLAAPAPAPRPRAALALRRATLADAGQLLAWRNDPETRRASHQTGAVSPADHQAWLARSLADPRRVLWIAGRGDEDLGTVRADHDAAAGHTTLSWTVAPAQRGTGVGRAMVVLAAQSLAGRLHAEVKAENFASARIARAAGFSETRRDGDTLHLYRPAG